jgi:hypothetical protein
VALRWRRFRRFPIIHKKQCPETNQKIRKPKEAKKEIGGLFETLMHLAGEEEGIALDAKSVL